MQAIQYLKNYKNNSENIINIEKYRGLDENNINLIEQNNLIVIINSGLDGNNKVAFVDENYTDEFKNKIIDTIAKNQKWFVARFH